MGFQGKLVGTRSYLDADFDLETNTVCLLVTGPVTIYAINYFGEFALHNTVGTVGSRTAELGLPASGSYTAMTVTLPKEGIHFSNGIKIKQVNSQSTDAISFLLSTL